MRAVPRSGGFHRSATTASQSDGGRYAGPDRHRRQVAGEQSGCVCRDCRVDQCRQREGRGQSPQGQDALHVPEDLMASTKRLCTREPQLPSRRSPGHSTCTSQTNRSRRRTGSLRGSLLWTHPARCIRRRYHRILRTGFPEAVITTAVELELDTARRYVTGIGTLLDPPRGPMSKRSRILKQEVRRVLEEHQPRYDEHGPRRTCSCNSNVGGGRIQDAVADHQADEILRRLRYRGLLQ